MSKNILSKIESITKPQRTEVVVNKPKKIDSAFLDIMERKGAVTNTFIKRNVKEKEHQELEKIEKLSTFDKILKLQKLLKETTSMKARFQKNKDKILNNINNNTFKYYENKINMKEIYDYCQSDNLEEHIKYNLAADSKSYFELKKKELYGDIYNFFFLIRNNNKLMIKLVDKCDIEDYENLCDFLINFCYEDTINSSFIQEELMLIIYLIFENNLIKMPNQILNNENNISKDLFRNKENIIYHILRSLSRKADIRNFLCSIFIEVLNDLQAVRKNLSLKSIKEEKQENDKIDYENILNSSFDKNFEKLSEIEKTRRHNTMRIQNPFQKMRLSDPEVEKEEIIKVQTNKNLDDLIKKDKDNNKKEAEKKEKDDIQGNKEEDIKDKDIFKISDNISEDEINKVKIDEFFEKNDITLTFLQKKLRELNNTSKNNSINLAMKDYFELLIKNINENKEEIYSSKKMINYFKFMILNEKNEDNKANLEINNMKDNYNNITKIIDEIISKLKENITTVPVIIKCILNVIEQLLNKKYIERKPSKLINQYQKYIFKSNAFFGNFILSSLKNLDYNGIFVSDIISKTTKENLDIIIKIIDKMLSGELFTNSYEILYNKYIFETLPKIFDIIDKIEKNFKLPDVLQRLVNTCTDKNNTKRLQDFEYDYFFEKNEEIQYQSLCFNIDNLLVLIKLAKKNVKTLYNFEEKDKKVFEKIFEYENFLIDLNKGISKEKKCDFFYLVKLNFSSKTEKRINSILRDNFSVLNQSQNLDNLICIKKCLLEVFEYANIINIYNFRFFMENFKRNISNHEVSNIIFRKNRQIEYENIINEKNILKEINKDKLLENNLGFRNVLFNNILEFLKLEIEKNYKDLKTQRIVFCAFYAQTNLKYLPKEYKENNYKKLLIELIKETMEKLNYLNSNILNQLYNKIKEGNKLNLIIASNYLQVKSLEKFKCIEFLFNKSLLPLEFNIELDENNIIKKVEYSDDAQKKKEEEAKKDESKQVNQNDEFVIIVYDKNNEEEKDKKEKPNKKITKENFPDFRKFENSIDDIVKLEEDCLMAEALKNYFQKLKKVVKAEKIIKRFSKDEIDSILIELENHMLFKFYDKLYPLKTSKMDDKFYKKCCRLSFIKPENIITDKNIYNKDLWQFSMDYLNQINDKYTPQDKLKVVLKSFGILQNSISFSSGKKELGVDDTIKPLIYLLIKSQPRSIFTNYSYCQLFLNDNLCKTQYGILLTQLYMIMNIIKDMKYTDLIGVSEEKFGKDED